MKTFFRLVTLGLILSGWGLAALSLHVIRTPGRLMVIPKDRLGIGDTYVDARNWTVKDLHQHPLVVARLVHLDRSDVLAYAVDPRGGAVQSQLVDAVQHPVEAPTTSPVVVEKVKDQFNTASKTVRSMFD
jgi:hypothetical protein